MQSRLLRTTIVLQFTEDLGNAAFSLGSLTCLDVIICEIDFI